MTRYLIGRRASVDSPPRLNVTSEPPFITELGKEGAHVSWGNSSYAWRTKRGFIEEWSESDTCARVIARVFPDDPVTASELARYDADVATARLALDTALAQRQTFLDAVAPRCKRVRLADAKRERESKNAEIQRELAKRPRR